MRGRTQKVVPVTSFSSQYLYFYPWKRCGYVLGLSQIPPTVCPYKTDTFFYLSEAGLQAVRKNRYVIMPKDFEKGYKSSVRKPGDDFAFYK